MTVICKSNLIWAININIIRSTQQIVAGLFMSMITNLGHSPGPIIGCGYRPISHNFDLFWLL